MYTDLRARGISFSVSQEYTADIFVGASISVNSEAVRSSALMPSPCRGQADTQDLASLAGAAGVINIIPVHLIPIPYVPTTVLREFVRASLQSLPSSQVADNATQAVLAASGNNVRRTGFSALPQISADKVQATGNRGKGIKIGIIDTGVDYTRTPLGGCFGPACKIVGGFDFVGDNYDGTNVPVPGPTPLDKCNGHGTVTAGIIGANDNEYGVPGVAPEASLYAYRTYGCTGTSGEDVLFLAMQKAYQDGVDVLNLSLGMSPSFQVSSADGQVRSPAGPALPSPSWPPDSFRAASSSSPPPATTRSPVRSSARPPRRASASSAPAPSTRPSFPRTT